MEMKTGIVAFAVLFGGCMPMATFTPVEYPAPQRTQAQLYSGAIRAIAAEGIGIATKDDVGGIVVSEWYAGQTDVMFSMRMRWRVLVDNGSVRVDADCQFAETDTQNWTPCGGDKRPEGATQRAQELATKIIAETDRIAAKAVAPQPTPAPAVANATPAQ